MRERVAFTGGGDFHNELRRRVGDQLTPALIRRGRRWATAKGALMAVWALASWVLLVFVVGNPWEAIAACVSLAFATAGVAFCVGHDGNHGAMYAGRRLNHLVGYSFDLIGASSYVWRTKHNVAHHTFTNVDGADADIDQMPFARLAPTQPHRRYHRFQHIYMWVLYGLFTFKVHVLSDFKPVFSGKIGRLATIQRPKRFDMTALFAGKVAFWTWAVVIPLFFRPWWTVLLIFVLCSWLLGMILAVVFQLAHAVDEAHFTDLAEMQAGPRPAWAAHQVESTVDFATGNRVLGWYLGGLNFQIEHHLFPKVSHIHYPRILETVRATCAEYGVKHTCQPTFRSALASHGRWLRAMGRGDGAVPTA
jgi:linoleoyl-CoA desaturase